LCRVLCTPVLLSRPIRTAASLQSACALLQHTPGIMRSPDRSVAFNCDRSLGLRLRASHIAYRAFARSPLLWSWPRLRSQRVLKMTSEWCRRAVSSCSPAMRLSLPRGVSCRSCFRTIVCRLRSRSTSSGCRYFREAVVLRQRSEYRGHNSSEKVRGAASRPCRCPGREW